jgi:hypothetical protein
MREKEHRLVGVSTQKSFLQKDAAVKLIFEKKNMYARLLQL